MGWPQSGYYMVGSDAVIGWQNGSAYPFFLGGKAKDTSGVLPNSRLTVQDANIDYNNGVTTMFFTRDLYAGWNPITDPSQMLMILSTHDTQDQLFYHTCTSESTYVVNLYDGTAVRGGYNNPQKNTHGILMLVAWGIFIPLGMISARYGRMLWPEPDEKWFYLHISFLTTGMFIASSAFVVAWVMTEGVYFNTSFHSQLGITVMILGYIQYFGGMFRPHKGKEEDPSGPRKVFEILHPNLGRFVLIIAIINIFAGISTWWPYYVHAIFACCVLFPLTVLVILGEAKLQMSKKE